MTNTPEHDQRLKFIIDYAPLPGTSVRTERLWGRWLDRSDGLVLASNNAFEVPLAVDDVVRVARRGDGWHVTEIVRLTESVVTWTGFGPPIPDKQAIATYDAWKANGHTVHTEGNGRHLMVSVWREFASVEEVLGVLRTDLAAPGWHLWHVFSPEDRMLEIQSWLRFRPKNTGRARPASRDRGGPGSSSTMR
ncbi:MAG: hypothetical protein Q4F67_08475 [Propionibacteriaceae bacterium]|nr:hypothetical protein [Propionibacteriaceae bacterium]